MTSTPKFEFKQDEVNKAISGYESANISESQQIMIDDVAEIITKSCSVPLNMLKGFIHLAILSWQDNKNMLLKEVHQFEPDEKEKVVEELAEKLKFMLKAILVKPEQWKNLERGIDESFRYYRENWKNRPK